MAAVAAIALVTAGVHNPSPPRATPRRRWAPAARPRRSSAAGIGSAAALDPDPVASPAAPDETTTPLPAPPIEARTSLKPGRAEPEPAPVQAADDSRPAPDLDGPVDLSLAGPTVRSDLHPGAASPAPIPPEGREGRAATSGTPVDRAGSARPGPVEAPTRTTLGPPRDPARAVAASTRGLDFLALNSFGPAVAEFDEAIRLDPGQAANYLPRALARHGRPGYRRVRPGLTTTGDPAPARRRQRLHRPGSGPPDLGREAFGRAIAEFDEAIRLDPNFASAYFHRGVARHGTRYLTGALADYDEAIRRYPGDARAYIARGQAHHDFGDYTQAIADFDRALQIDDGDSDALYPEGLARFKSADYTGALADSGQALRLDPKDDRAIRLRDNARTSLASQAKSPPDLEAWIGRSAVKDPVVQRTSTGPEPRNAPPAAQVAQPPAGWPGPTSQPPPRRPQPVRKIIPRLLQRPDRAGGRRGTQRCQARSTRERNNTDGRSCHRSVVRRLLSLRPSRACSSRPFAWREILQDDCGPLAECGGISADRLECRVAFAVLDLAERGPVDPRSLGDVGQTQAQRLAGLLQFGHRKERIQERAEGIGAEYWDPMRPSRMVGSRPETPGDPPDLFPLLRGEAGVLHPHRFDSPSTHDRAFCG